MFRLCHINYSKLQNLFCQQLFLCTNIYLISGNSMNQTGQEEQRTGQGEDFFALNFLYV